MRTADYNNKIFKQLEEVMKKCDGLSQEIKDIKKEHKKEILELEAKHIKEVNKLNNRIDTLEKENSYLKIENKILKDDNDRLKSIINRDSTNSSIPPSKDEKPKRKNINLREKTNKKTGGQRGHKGTTLTKNDVELILQNKNVEKEIIPHGNVNGKYCITKYELDVKNIVVVREHKFFFDKKREIKFPKEFLSDVHYGEAFKTLCNIMVVEEVISLERIQEFVEILTGGVLKISQGSLVNWIKEKSKECIPVLKKMKIALKNSTMIHTDLTETAVNGKKGYVRNYSTEKMTVYVPSKDKKIHKVKRQWILQGYTGYIIHDHDTSMYNFGILDKHVECNVHLRRYLKNNIELTHHEWALEMDKLLLEIKTKKEEYLANGGKEFSEAELEAYSQNYDSILEKGYEECKQSNSKYLKQEEKALLNRLKKYKSNHLLYAYNFEVPFDNNLSERDLRAIKTKKKVSGGHRSYRGLKDYCNIRSIISTCRKHGIDFFKVLVNIKKEEPAMLYR